MTQPVTWPARDWGGGPNVYDIRSYGATLTDIGPALLAAMHDATTRSSGGTIFIPPLLGEDQAWGLVTPVAYDAFFAGIKGVNQIRIRGHGSRVNYQGDPGQYAISFANAGQVIVEGLSFEQPQWQSSVPLSLSILNFSSCAMAVVDACAFVSTTCSLPVVAFGSINGASVVRDCYFDGAGSNSDSFGTVSCITGDCHTVKIDGNFFVDGANGTTNHILLNRALSVEINANFFDEFTNRCIYLAGASGNIVDVSIHDNFANRPIGAQGMLVADTCQSVEVSNWTFKGSSLIGTTGFDLRAIQYFTLRGTQPIATTPTNILMRSGGAGIGQVILDGSPGWTPVTTGAGFSPPKQRYVIDGVPQPVRVSHAGSPYTLQQSQLTLYADVSGGAITGNIPAANTMPDGWPMELRRTAGSFAVNNMTLAPAAGSIMDPQNPGAAPGASVVVSTNGAFRWRAGVTENVWELA